MKLLLIAINAKFIHSNPAVYSLQACTGAYRSHVEIAEFTINEQPAWILREIYKKKPDVIAFSCYIWNRNIIGSIVHDLHRLLPDTDLWAGGPEVSYHAWETIKEWGLRGVMTGPGEGTFARLVSCYVHGTADSLPAVLTADDAPKLSLDEIPFWQEDLADFGHRIIYYESSRGCPFCCSYCLSSIDHTMDFRNAARVCRELDFFLERKVTQVKFVDRTFNCNKEHALPILRHIAAHDNGITNFHFEIAADLLDEDYFALLEQMRPGAVQLEIGVQSVHAPTIREIHRSMDLEKVAAAVRRIHAWRNIHIHLDLIAGLPLEDFATFAHSFNEVYALRPQQLQLGFLKVLKGSGMALHAAEYGLVSSCQPPYEVLSTNWLSYDDVCHLKQIEEMVERYYNSGQFTHTLEFLCPYFETPFAMYDALAAWYESHNLSAIQSSRLRKYEILLEFAADSVFTHGKTPLSRGSSCPHRNEPISCEPDCSKGTDAAACRLSALKEYLTYDMYLREHMKNRPSFALPAGRWRDSIRDILQKESETHALFPELSGCSYRELTKQLHAEIFIHICREPAVILFCYQHRDPLTNNCSTATIPLSNERPMRAERNEGTVPKQRVNRSQDQSLGVPAFGSPHSGHAGSSS